MIHRYWTGPNPVPNTSYVAEGVLKNSFDLEVTDWTDENLPPEILMAINLVEGLVPESEQIKHRSNVVRLLLLKKFGGVWLDHDFILMSTPVQDTSRLEIAVHPNGSVCPCYIVAPPDHPTINKAISMIHPEMEAAFASGSGLLNHVCRDDPTVIRRILPFDHQGFGLPSWKNTKNLWGIHVSHRGSQVKPSL